MRNKLCKSLFLLIMCCVLPMTVSAGGENDDKTPDVPAKYNVKCEYKLKSALSGNLDLTTFAIYVDETNSKYKLTYLDKLSYIIGEGINRWLHNNIDNSI